MGGVMLADRCRPATSPTVAPLYSPANYVLRNPLGGVFHSCEELGIPFLAGGSQWATS
jgi:hypothetical protein